MVLDKVTEEVVTIKELLKRDRYRSSTDDRSRSASEFSSAPSGGSSGVVKRKVGDDEGFLPDADSKRLCVEG